MATGDPVRCVLEVPYPDAAKARAVHEALSPDNAGYVRSRTERAILIAEMEAETPMKLLHTVEDYLACLTVAEKAVDAARG